MRRPRLWRERDFNVTIYRNSMNRRVGDGEKSRKNAIVVCERPLNINVAYRILAKFNTFVLVEMNLEDPWAIRTILFPYTSHSYAHLCFFFKLNFGNFKSFYSFGFFYNLDFVFGIFWQFFL